MIRPRAARHVRAARLRSGLTQRELARRTGIPQPTIAAIEAGRQDPRHVTLERLLRACGFEWDIHRIPGDGIDRSLITTQLALSPTARIDRLALTYRSIAPLRGVLRRR